MTPRNQAHCDARMAAHFARVLARARGHFDRDGGAWSARLTARQARFVELYLFGRGGRGLSATRAAEAAGYRWPSRQGPRLLTFPAVNAAVEAAACAAHPGFADVK